MPTTPTASISLRTEGGFAHIPGFAAGIAINVEDLPATDRHALRIAIEDANFFRRPTPPPSKQVRDGRTHHLGITFGDRSRLLTVPEPVEDQSLSDLIALVRKIARKPDGGGPAAS